MNSKFSDKLEKAIQKNEAFVLFRKPNETEIHLFVQDNSNSNRFLMHSFDSKTEKVISDQFPVSISQKDFNFNFELKLEEAPDFSAKSQSEYEKLIQNTIQTIQTTEIRKIVISRIKVVENQNYSILKSFKNLVENHAGALVYLWHQPGHETWMGATPELLISQRGKEVNTVSLAGTKSPEMEWTEKELDEQKIVTDYILDNLSVLENLKVKGPETVSAGKFQHLKSYVSGEITDDFSIDSLLQKLHPTPAVCGLPKQDAFRFIIENEGYNREFYSGYVGIDSPRRTKEYFVNLRSGQFFRDKIWLYVGGGITADSIPEKEWKETELKSGTVLSSLIE